MDQQVSSLNPWLLAGMVASAVAAVIHLGCIAFGAPWYRFLGAGEDMAQMAEAGQLRPHLITLAIALVLSVWAVYALAAAGQPLALPAIRWVLLGITAIYLLRGIGGYLIAVTPTHSLAFLMWSSSICLAIGAVHAIGLWQVWQRL